MARHGAPARRRALSAGRRARPRFQPADLEAVRPRFWAACTPPRGALPGSVDVEVFVGRYPHTIPGIHRERSGVFVSMVQGAKDILVWPPDATGCRSGRRAISRRRPRARRLRCAPGRLVYWPAMHWHVGESPAQGTAGLHIAVLEDPLTVRDLMGGTSELDAAVAARISPGWADGSSRTTWPCPQSSMRPSSRLSPRTRDRDAVRDRLMAGWLRRRTALGFPAVPPVARSVLHPDQVLTRDGVHPIVVAPRDAAHVLGGRRRPRRLRAVGAEPGPASRPAELRAADLGCQLRSTWRPRR